MKVSTAQPFQLIYSLYQHEYLGYLFESFVVQLDEKGRLTLQHQNISSKNAREFESGCDENDYKLIKLMDEMQQDSVVLKFYKKKVKPDEFFFKVYDKERGDKVLQESIELYLETRRAKILDLLKGKMIFEMGRDGEPAWKQIHWVEEKATVLFHFRRNEDNTHYFPTIKLQGEKLEWQYNNSYLVCLEPAWLIVKDKLISFEKNVDGNKLKPFLNKKFIVIPQKVEETYYQKFVTQLVASFDVYAKGFEINAEKYPTQPVINFSELVQTTNGTLFDSTGRSNQPKDEEDSKILFKLAFKYGPYQFNYEKQPLASVKLEKSNGSYIFHKVNRNANVEVEMVQELSKRGLKFQNGRATLPRATAFNWLNENADFLHDFGIEVQQTDTERKKYFVGESKIEIKVEEGIDWFDIKATVRFGEFEITFQELRKLINKHKREVKLPNGEIAVIPEAWIKDYAELFAFMEETDDQSTLKLRKHHLSLIQDLQSGSLAQVTMDRKLQKLQEFEEIEDYEMPAAFNGTLRPYQKAGYNWMRFLSEYNFGGCLADDMGLGKTVQTLALLQAQTEHASGQASLLVMPTSLIYNWQIEASKFTPNLRVLVYTGTNRDKNAEQFANYDLVVTSYGITRIDIDILSSYYFNYVILDESQAIKNPDSLIAKCVTELKSRHRLILTGTPLENSTFDLWSQMSFINPGLLGAAKYFKNEFQQPIEKRGDIDKTRKLNVIIKPFILRRQKSQVARDLPEKFESVKYSQMTPEQEEKYEEVKSHYRNQILDTIEKSGIKKSQLLLLQGLTKLRQIANHPKMVEPDFEGGSGKLEDITYMIESAISEGHKILVFSQFVKHLSIVKEFLEDRKVDFTYLDGSTKDRQGQVEKFQNNEDIKVFLISLKAGGLGLNLTKADYVFLLDPWWNPAIEEQAVDRAHRIGQVNTVFTYKFITRNTVEEKILALQKNKLKLANDLITTEESFIKKLTTEDISELLS
ncbi:SNF2-related protein [uncultured Roseivirga sp.]|uniref:DEAD/DEAH box helicase n=1 Tax=uncultured Roseivirga sp. TaxID=543088 RepID=UPI000D796A7B|nr:SNF2-related protein [uncultured Roseivirga sp.]PWL30772.1 MAG: helicase SNF2 [Roseivirga sp. XM-24bin3]